jgi:hypothetical protein
MRIDAEQFRELPQGHVRMLLHGGGNRLGSHRDRFAWAAGASSTGAGVSAGDGGGLQAKIGGGTMSGRGRRRRAASLSCIRALARSISASLGGGGNRASSAASALCCMLAAARANSAAICGQRFGRGLGRGDRRRGAGVAGLRGRRFAMATSPD